MSGDGVPRLDDRDWLEGQYHGEGRSLRDIASELGVSGNTVRSRLLGHGLETRSHSEPSDERLADEGWLRERYEGRGLSMGDIAGELGVSANTVKYWLEKHGVEAREGGTEVIYTELRDDDWLRIRYRDGMTMQELTDAIGCSVPAVREAMDRHGIERRARGPRGLSLDPEEVRAKRQEGMSLRELADHFGCSTYPIRRALDR